MLPTSDAEWRKLYDAISQEQIDLDRSGASHEEKHERLASHFDDEAAGPRALTDWMHNFPDFALPTIVVPSTKDYLDTINTTNFSNAGQIQKLARILSTPRAPYIPLGNFQGLPFRLVPHTRVLRSDLPSPRKGLPLCDGGRMLPHSFLAVRPKVSPMVYGTPYERVGKRNHVSSEFITEEEDFFVFHQLGLMEHSSRPLEELSEQDRSHEDWLSPGFAVVMRLLANGKPDGVYIIFNFIPWDSTIREHVTYGKKYDLWGYLPGSSDQIFYAKIANRFEDLAEGKDFELTRVHHDPAELSWAVKKANGAITIDPKVSKISQRLHDVGAEKLRRVKKSKADRKAGNHHSSSRIDNLTPQKSRQPEDVAASHNDDKNDEQTAEHHPRTSPTASEKSPPIKKHRKDIDDEGSRARLQKSVGNQETEQVGTTSPDTSMFQGSRTGEYDTGLVSRDYDDGQETEAAVCAQDCGANFGLQPARMHTGECKDIAKVNMLISPPSSDDSQFNSADSKSHRRLRY